MSDAPVEPVEAPEAPDVHPDQEPLTPPPDTGDYPAPGGPPEHDDTTGTDPPAERRYGE